MAVDIIPGWTPHFVDFEFSHSYRISTIIIFIFFWRRKNCLFIELFIF